MNQARWTLREIFLAVAWISAGLALFRITWLQLRPGTSELSGFLMVTHFATWAAMGAGIGTLFKRQFMGGLVGLIVALFVPCLLLPIAAAFSSFK